MYGECMSKTSKFIIPGLVLGASSLFADNGCPPPPAKPKPECCPSKCGQMSHQRGPKREITPNAGPCVADGADLFVTADFIYWTAHEDNLGFAFTDIISSTSLPGTGGAPSTPTGMIAYPNFKFKPGFKVGLGLDFDHDGWDLFTQYTWFRSAENRRTITASTLSIGTDQLTIPTGTTITSAKGNWGLDHYDVIDLELGRNFYISRYLMLRPFAGMKGTWQKQKFDVAFFGNTPSLGVSIYDNQELKTWGVGLRAGLDASWHFTKSFSMLGNLAFSGVWEQFKTSRMTNQLFSDGSAAALNHIKSNYHSVKPVIEWQLGLRWETWFCDDSYHFSIEGAWEMQWWGDQNAFLVNDNHRLKLGDLTLQGFTLHLRFDF